jgi:hypothetical protein
MNDPNSDSPDDKIDAKLQAVAEAMAAPPPWYDAWSKLTAASSDEDRLAVYRAIRRRAFCPPFTPFPHFLSEGLPAGFLLPCLAFLFFLSFF